MLRYGQIVFLCVLALLTLGVVMVNSAGMSVDPREAVTVKSILLSRSTAYMALAVAAMACCAMLPIRRMVPRAWLASADGVQPETEPDGLLVSGDFARNLLRTIRDLWPMWLIVGALLAVLATVYIPGLGRTVNGSSRWISLRAPGLESIQPSELAKWALVGLLAWYGATNMHRLHKFWRGLLPGLCAAGAVAAFIVVEDLGTGVLLGLVACVVLVAAGARVWHLAVLAPLPLTMVALAISTSQYRRDRLLAFMNPYADADGIGYHMIQSMVAVANGNLAGRGLGHGLQKFGYLPEDRTDFLFAVICEELGVAGAFMVVALYGLMFYACWVIIRREQSAMLKLLGLGVTATVAIQAIINLAVVTGLGPTKGIALPLLSSGGTGWILTAASLGLIVAMDRTQDGWTAPVVAPAARADEESPEPEAPAAEVEPLPLAAEPDESRFAPPGYVAATAPAALAAAVAHDDSAAMTLDDDGEQGLLFAPATEIDAEPVVAEDQFRVDPAAMETTDHDETGGPDEQGFAATDDDAGAPEIEAEAAEANSEIVVRPIDAEAQRERAE